MFTHPLFVRGIAFFNVKFCIEPILLMPSWPKSILTEQTCNRCGQAPADFVHMFLSCPILSEFWAAIFQSLSKAAGQIILLEPLTALFGLYSSHSVPKSTRKIIAFTTLLARRLILLKWSHSSPPTHYKWIQDILQCITLEKIRLSLKGSLSSFYKMWQPFITYIDSLTIVAETN